MIKSLTKEQESKLEVYRDKWINIGLSTEPTNKERATANVGPYYAAGGLKPPKTIIFAKSPFQAMVIINVLQSDKFWKTFKKELEKTGTKVEKQDTDSAVNSDVDSAVYSAVNSAVFLAVDSAVRFAVTSAVDSAVYSAVNSAVTSAVDSAVYSAVNSEKLQWIGNYAGGNLWPGWQSFYDYFDQELNIKGLEIIRPTLELSKDCGWIFPYEHLCVLVEKPEMLKMKAGRLHAEEAPAMRWKDGFSIYALNGVIMPKEIMSQAKDKVLPKDILQLKNAEQRMQGMKYIGLGKFFDSLTKKVVDKKDDYELLLIDHEGEQCEYLKMVNPSTGEIHLEGIQPGLKTVDQALAWRNGLEYWINPLQLT